jgi:hypothetical protein
MRRTLFATVLSLAVLAAGAPALEAQAFRIGAQGTYSSRTFQDAWGVGGRAAVGIPLLPIEILGVFDYYFPSCPAGEGTCSAWGGVVNVMFADGRDGPYIGAGGVYNYAEAPGADDDGNTVQREFKDWGFNLNAGIVIDWLPVINPFFDFRYEWYTGDADDQFVLGFGIIY